MRVPFSPVLRRCTVAVAALAIVALAGCSNPETDEGPVADGDVSAEVISAVDAGYDGNSGPIPADSPAPAENRDVWIIAAFQQVSTVAELSAESAAAAEAIGWTSNICDGQNNANGAWAACVRTAVASGADAIILESIDCAAVRQPLVEAREAGVLIAGITSFDCDDPTQGGSDPLFDVSIKFAGVDSLADYFREIGKLRADWIIAQTGGTAKILHVEFEGISFGTYLSEGFTAEIEKCKGCEVVQTLAVTPPDIPQIRQKFETALLQARDVDAIAIDVDFMLSVGGIQASLAATGGDYVVAGGECAIENLDFIRADGGQDMCIGSANGRISWATIDEINRAFAGEEPADDGVGRYLVDRDHNLPDAGHSFPGSVEFRDAYTQLWDDAR